MWTATAAISSPLPFFSNSLSNRTNSSAFRLRASNLDYPLASRIVVKNLPYSTKESSLQKEFSNFGQIAELKLVIDEVTKRSKGYAFIQYTSQDDAMLAIENMDQKVFDGRLVFVEIARPGKYPLGRYPKTSGPPKKLHLPEQDEIADCWY